MSEGKVFKWKCTVCGYIEEGVNPPDECPICGVGPEMFEKIEEEKTSNEEKSLNSKKSENLEKSEKPKLEETKGNTYIWKCTVCGYIEEGAQPPEKCPVCGVGPEYFVKLEETKEEKNQENDSISAKKENIVIIGASGAGMGAAVEIRKRNKASDITILSKEGVKGYYRPQLTKMLSRNDVTIEQLAIKTDDWFKENKVKLLLNKVVERIDTVNSKVILKDNEEIPYTKLIIASGAEVFVPPLEGRDKKGVFTLRYVKDGDEIKDYAKGKNTAAIIGGGILGLEAASELNKMGLEVTVLERGDRILPRQLDHDASKVLEQIVDNVGVNFLKFVNTKEIIGDEAVKGILLDNGETVQADVVIISTGVKANTEIAKDTGIEIKRAIVVNERMETAVPGIYACGDCAEYEGINYALWSEAIEQGKTAGINAAKGDYTYSTIIPSTTLNAFGTSVFSIGDIGSDPEAEYKTYEGNDSKSYIKLYFKNNILAGGILIGDTSKTVVLINGFEKSKTMDEMIEKFKA